MELNKKLAEWAGWHWEKYQIATDGAQARVLLSPDEAIIENQVGCIPDHTPNFSDDLNACFKWLVPEALEALAKGGYNPPIMKLFQLWYDELVSLTGDSSNVQQAALALCLAIEKLIIVQLIR